MDLPVINSNYFKGISVIPNKEQPYINIDNAVERFTPDFYVSVFGYDFYKALLAGWDSGVTTSIWYKILYGSEFTVSDVVYKWDGLFRNTTEVSPLADWIWLQYIKEIWHNTTVGGVLQIVPTDSVQDTTDERTVAVSNRMEAEIRKLYDFIYYSTDTELGSVKSMGYPYEFQDRNRLGI